MPEISEPLNFARVGGKSKMERRNSARRALVSVSLTVCLVVVTAGLTCPPTGGDISGLNPPVPPGNRPPRVLITAIDTPKGGNIAEVGDLVTISFTGEDGEDTAVVRIFASTSSNPTPAQEVQILNNFPIGPGVGSGTASWNTTVVPLGSYNIFAEINDGTNPTIRVVSAQSVQVTPVGSTPVNSPPQIVVLEPKPNLGLSTNNDLTVQYQFKDLDSQNLTVTMVLDKDLIPDNDDINNPGQPYDPNSKIILLPDSGLQPEDDPNSNPDLRRNPRIFDRALPLPTAFTVANYRFRIDITQIPVRAEPYYIRATISDGNSLRHSYAIGSLTIAAGASGLVKVEDLGFGVAGARFLGFNANEHLGSDITTVDDVDKDKVSDFMIAGRFSSPRNWPESGAAYLIFGRSKLPFPPDSDNDGVPDGYDPVPPYVRNPYDSTNIGRFGGALSINSVGSFFRGAIYAMPPPIGSSMVPNIDPVVDPTNPGRHTAGLLSITRVDMTDDDIPDFVFGLPFISGAIEYVDDDPNDGSCDLPVYDDTLPNSDRCKPGGLNGSSDDMTPVDANDSPMDTEIVDEGIVCVVDGTNNLNTTRFIDVGLAGQNDSDPEKPQDYDGVIVNEPPTGMRFRGGWLADPFSDSLFGATLSALPNENPASADEPPKRLVISIPAANGGKGEVQIWPANNYLAATHYADTVLSLPGIRTSTPDACTEESAMGAMDTKCRRESVPPPHHQTIVGAMNGDGLGYGAPAGQVNQDGVLDIVVGAPSASRGGLMKNGVMYVLFPSAAGLGTVDLGAIPPSPQLRITGTHDDDQFGKVQTTVRDIDGDGIDDFAFASENYDADVNGDLFDESDVGFVGVIFGDRPLTGENGFSPDDVGTSILRGVRFIGAVANGRAGRRIASAGDFNGDGFYDLLISAPGESRTVDGVSRPGVVYLIFGGPHLAANTTNNVFNLRDVGTPALPGIVFVSRLLQADPTVPGPNHPETLAPLETVGGIGDIDGDGFDDIAIGAPTADFVNTASPNQRRIDAGEAYIIYGNDSGSNSFP